jgi:hypothetical protein
MKCVLLATIASGLFYPISILAQTDAVSSLEVLPRSSRVLLLTIASPSASQPIVIDAVKRADIMVSALSTDLSVDLISPQKKRYSIGQTRSDFDSWVSIVAGLGANYRAILTNPDPGTWTLEVNAKKLAGDLDVVVNLFFDSAVFVSLVAGDIEHRVGGMAALSLAAFQEATRLRGMTIRSEVRRPNGSSMPLLFRDDGSDADFVANDGVYTALLNLPLEGEYRVDATVRGTAAGLLFERTAVAHIRARRPVATLGATFIDRSVDDNADGLFDAITVAPSVSVVESGVYHVSVRLRAGEKILQKAAIVELSPGVANPIVRFPAEDVRLVLAQDGPYSFDVVFLERREPHDVVFVDKRSEVGLTQAFRVQDLQRPRSRIVGTPTAAGFDANNNGKFDQLRVTVDVDIDLPDEYWLSGSIYDSNRDHIGNGNGKATLAAGRNRVVLAFEGADIGRHGVDGPYGVRFSMLGPTSSAAAKIFFRTGVFTASQFEASQPDTTPPTLSVTMTPSVLWPPNQKMVEVVPAFDARDDRDPAPAVRLRWIDTHEDDSLMPNPSPDVRVEDGRIFLLATRYGKAKGRTYTLTFVVEDRAGNEATATATVRVPHDQSTP